MKPTLSVVMATYQRPQHLRLALTGYLRQSFADFEIVVADDGSGPETAELIQGFGRRAPFPVHHVWQEDRGYRRTAILNRGIARAAADYIVFSDGDCVPAPDLLERHLRERRPERMLIGGYLRVPMEVGDAADEDWVLRGGFQAYATAAGRRRLRRRHWKNNWQIWTRRRRRPHNLGLNMSLWKPDLLRVNGFDENIVGWGNDDGDLRERLKLVGVWPYSIWNRALVYHLDHPVETTRRRRPNYAYVTRPGLTAFAENGIQKPEATG